MQENPSLYLTHEHWTPQWHTAVCIYYTRGRKVFIDFLSSQNMRILTPGCCGNEVADRCGRIPNLSRYFNHQLLYQPWVFSETHLRYITNILYAATSVFRFHLWHILILSWQNLYFQTLKRGLFDVIVVDIFIGYFLLRRAQFTLFSSYQSKHLWFSKYFSVRWNLMVLKLSRVFLSMVYQTCWIGSHI